VNLLVLDIDGVVCSRRAHFGIGKYGGMMTAWDRESCGMIRFLCKRFNFKIVISSTWRIGKNRRLLIKRLKENDLYKFLLPPKARYTPYFSDIPSKYFDSDFNLREIEIIEWFKIWKERLDIGHFFIIDDDSCPVFGRNWIQTDIGDGFGEKHFRKIWNEMIEK